MAATSYNFKSMHPVPTSKDFIDIVLSKTQRKTPTIIHARYAIKEIREFYMRKVKFAQQTFHDKLNSIIEEFPRLDDIHPFYSDLINVLYDKDHYKLALGQINVCSHLIDTLAKDYTRLLKYGDSLFRCKQLKRAALGRMCTLMTKQTSSLAYLEEVRQHLSRLPNIDPSTRTLILTGFPNVGKSSFINKVTQANVDVQPYPFTTKSLFVGHLDYKYLRWQVIDTPGILDHSLEERNTIEMQAITALAHLHCCVLFFMDISGTCGYSIPQQIELYQSIRPLFAQKPVVIVANKTDLLAFDKVATANRQALEALVGNNVFLLPMSNMTQDGISQVKITACDLLLSQRVDSKLTKKSKIDELANRLTVTYPKARDNKERPAFIPRSLLNQRNNMAVDEDGQKVTEKYLEQTNGGAGVYNPDWRIKHFDLANDDWRTDMVPEIMDGKNIADFVDADIDARLAELEEEEDRLQKAAEEAEDDWEGLDEEQSALVKEIKDKQFEIRADARHKDNASKVIIPRSRKAKTVAELAKHLEKNGIESHTITTRLNSRGRSRADDSDEDLEFASALGKQKRGRSKVRSESQSVARRETLERHGLNVEKEDKREGRSKSRAPTPAIPQGGEGFKNPGQKLNSSRLSAKVQKTLFGRVGKLGESDRFIGTAMPKHLFAGKMSNGTRNHR